MAIDIAKGKNHDFKVFKKSEINKKILKEQRILADSGYQGIKKLHDNSITPHKRKRNEDLTEQQIKENQKHASERIYIEHVNAEIKTFKITKNCYRNRRKRVNTRLILICAFINLNRSIIK